MTFFCPLGIKAIQPIIPTNHILLFQNHRESTCPTMGCGGSKPSRDNRRKDKTPARLTIGGPQDVQIHIPRNRADEHGVPVQQVTRDIDHDVLLSALDHVSSYIARSQRRISVMAVGGAVNTLYLRSRSTTHDVDIFGSDFNNQARILLDAAMQDAQRTSPGLGPIG